MDSGKPEKNSVLYKNLIYSREAPSTMPSLPCEEILSFPTLPALYTFDDCLYSQGSLDVDNRSELWPT